jgi:agmatine/peptidylarginine deiminase
MKKAITILTISLLMIIGISLTAGDGLHYYEESLPIGLTPEEKENLDKIGEGHIRTAPPPPPIRNCAEWEPSEGVIIRYPLGISYAVVKEMAEDVMVTTIVSSTYYMNQAINNYTAQGVNMSNVRFLIAATDSWWTRDYGPWFIFDGTDSLGIVDHIYNRPRPYDDQIPWIYGDTFDLEVYGMDVVHTGGNHMSDGLGMSMSTRLVYNENSGLTHAEVDSIMLAFLGNDYTVLEYIESGGIHHIDCWAKFLSPTTILVKDVPPSDYSYALLNARAEYLSQQISAWGEPYTVVRVYCPYGTAYTNSLILNNKVLVPTFNNSYDDDALQTYADAMPGYEIIGFDGSWYDDDALHCRAMGVPDRGMLFVHHIPLTTTGDSLNDYEVGVKIKAHSGAGLIPDSLKIFYRTKDPQFNFAYLTPTAAPDSFAGFIPAHNPGTTIEYYVQAADSSGRLETHPYIGAPGAHKFNINSAPAIISGDTIMCETSDPLAYCPEFTDPDDTLHEISYSDYPGWLSEQNDSLVGTAPASPAVDSFSVTVADPYTETTQTVTIIVFVPYVCGDVNDDGSVNILDISYLIYYLYNGGPPPVVWESGDVNASGDINILDISYLIDYLYMEGPEPICE